MSTSCITITPHQAIGPEFFESSRYKPDNALVAQMDRVLASEAKGRGFDSRRARQFPA